MQGDIHEFAQQIEDAVSKGTTNERIHVAICMRRTTMAVWLDPAPR